MSNAKLLVLSVQNRPGAVADALAALSEAGIGLRSILGWAPQNVLQLVVTIPQRPVKSWPGMASPSPYTTHRLWNWQISQAPFTLILPRWRATLSICARSAASRVPTARYPMSSGPPKRVATPLRFPRARPTQSEHPPRPALDPSTLAPCYDSKRLRSHSTSAAAGTTTPQRPHSSLVYRHQRRSSGPLQAPNQPHLQRRSWAGGPIKDRVP